MCCDAVVGAASGSDKFLEGEWSEETTIVYWDDISIKMILHCYHLI
jgi:hypothetical protein